MKKSALIVSLFLATATLANAAETVFEWDFSNGVEGFTIYDEDGCKPSTTAQKAGFSASGDSWIPVEYMKNPAVASNSTHSPIKRASDWLITPAITLSEGNVISFDAVTVSYTAASKVSEMDVFLSTTGTAVEDFTVELAKSVAVNGELGSYGYDLSAYAGQTVYIAIVNKGISKDILIVDNIFAGVPPIATIEPVYTKLQEKLNKGQYINVKLTAGFAEAISSLDATLTCGDFTTQRTVTGLEVAPGGVYSFQFNDPLPVPTPGEPQAFDISVLVNGKETVTTSGEVISQAYQPAKRVVCEEQTGTWCGWCVRGHVYMEMMAEDYPDTYIGIASHIGDVMQNYDYANYLSTALGTTGAPVGRVQRDEASLQCDPSQFPSLYKNYIKKPALADIFIDASWADESQNSIILTTTTTFALSAGNYPTRLEYIVLEDDVNKPGNNNYNQANYYAGGAQGAMGGYESKTDPVLAQDMFYDDVVRHVISDEIGLGIKGSVPTAITMGEAYKHTVTLDIPSSVAEINNCEFVVLLLDYETGVILNAAATKIINPAAVEKVTNDNTTRAYAYGDGVRVEVNADATVSVNIYSVDGRLVNSAVARKVNGYAAIDCSVNAGGVYLVNVVCDGVATTHKVVL